MAHQIVGDDLNIIQKCRDYGFCCTYDQESKFRQESVTDAIAAVLASREKQAEKLGRLVARTDKIMDPLDKLIDCAKELTGIPERDGGQEINHKDVFASYQNRLLAERDCLADNLRALKETKRVMERKNIRVPVVGLINAGKSTFLNSALGDMDEAVKKNLFPSANGHKSCTGTRTVLIYDDHTDGVMVTARFKDKAAFLNDCRQSVIRMTEVLERLHAADRFAGIKKLKKDLTDGSDPIALLNGYYQSPEFRALCKTQNKEERDEESIHDFCSFVYFSRNQDYSEHNMDSGTFKDFFQVNDLIKSWNDHTSYSIQIPSDNNFSLVKNFVCKYDPHMKQGMDRYTTYCGVEVIEIRGNLCRDIAGLELIDSVGADDDAASNEEQIKKLMRDSDAMILLKRPQSQFNMKWTIQNWVKLIRNEKKEPNQFLYLAYNCYLNNITIPSDVSHDLDNAKKYYSEDCKRIYVSDIGQWEEVQSKMLVDMLVNLSESVEETDKESMDRAKDAKAAVAKSIQAIRQIAEHLGQICGAEDEDASEKKRKIEAIFRELFGQVEMLSLKVRNENETTLRVRANAITESLTKNLKQEPGAADFNTCYEYISPTGPRYMYNRYAAFLCMYSRMLEDARRQYDSLKDDINAYVALKRKELLDILWEKGRFHCMMSDLEPKGSSGCPGAAKICGWLKQDGREQLAEALEGLLLQDVGAESLIDGSIGKIIEQFDPKNLTAEQLFGSKIAHIDVEKSENTKNTAMVEQLSVKADEIKAALLKSVAGSDSNGSNAPTAKTGQGSDGKKNDDAIWDNILKTASKDNGKQSALKSDQDTTVFGSNVFDLDKKVRSDVVCEGIFKKFRDRLRGKGLPQSTQQPISQLYNLYDHYYDVLLTKEEVAEKKRLSELRHDMDKVTKQLMALCQN
ncbi:MAG: hypothetical protein HFG71_10300 [Hungatella sp.]|jgi:hypothetical protein|nr:hypothetical protein [Hungatella sp.]